MLLEDELEVLLVLEVDVVVLLVEVDVVVVVVLTARNTHF